MGQPQQTGSRLIRWLFGRGKPKTIATRLADPPSIVHLPSAQPGAKCEAALATITFEQVTKRYDNGQAALSNLDLHIAEGEFLILVGPSGCGKSTALRIVAGLDDPTSGRLLIDGAFSNDAAPRDRNVAMVFQSYALYPHLSVARNIGFGLKVRGTESADIERKVREVAATLELTDYLGRKPAKLSGGQRQRVAMARALVRSPNAFLMDEPLSNLDARLRGHMRQEIAGLQRRTGVTTVYVTHDQVEAMTMGTRVAVLDRGLLQQVGPPRALYDAPQNRFVAGFIGSPAMNFFDAIVERSPEGVPALRLGRHRLAVDAGFDRFPTLVQVSGLPVVAGLRPEAFRLASAAEAGLPGTVRFVEDLGANLLVSVELEGVTPLGVSSGGDDEFAASRRHLKALLDGGLRLAPGDPVRLAADPRHLHLFDATTGLSLRA